MKRGLIVSIGLSVAGLLVSLVMWSKVPSPMPVHWNAAGQADGFAAKEIGLTMLPIISLATAGILAFVGKAMKQVKAKAVMAKVIGLVSFFMLAMHGLMIQASLREDMAMSMGALVALLGVLIAAVGSWMPGIEQNKFVGVRTPWTMTNEVNWKLTHNFAGYTMVGSGVFAVIVAMLTFMSVEARFWVAFTGIMIGSLAPVVYSYIIHRTRN